MEEFPGEMAAHDPLVPVHRFAHRNIIEKYLKPVLEKSGFSELFILRAEDGRVLVSTDSVQEEKYKTHQPFFEHGKTRTFIQNVCYSMSLQQPVMTVAVPIRDRLGRVIAVLAGRCRVLRQLSGSLRQAPHEINDPIGFVKNNIGPLSLTSVFSRSCSFCRIHISSESDGQCITVRVADTGAGIPPDVMGSIFGPFFTTKGVGKGTGLGLSISHGIIQKHGGTIEVESQVGEGTVFTIRFPVENENVSQGDFQQRIYHHKATI